MSTRKANQARVRPFRTSTLKLSAFARQLFETWKGLELPRSDAYIIVAVSGGADSTALLLGIDELVSAGKLNLNVVVAHLDHSLRQQSKEDANWVTELAQQLGYESVTRRVNVVKRAQAAGDNLEQAARHARYEFLAKTARAAKAQLILTAHTMDDQAETILLRLLRGSGADGLAGIEPVRHFDPGSDLLLARPLLSWARRSETEDYCRQRKIDYRTDAMNENEQFSRVRVRKQLVPLMASFNGRIVEALARTAELLRDDLAVLNQAAEQLLLDAIVVAPANKPETKGPALDVSVLANAPAAVRRRALRQWISAGRGDLRRFELVHIIGVEKLLQGDRGGRVAELPGGARVVRKQKRLELLAKKE